MHLQFSLLGAEQAQQVHDAGLRLLRQSGMCFESPALQEGLRQAGAQVDPVSGRARIPERLVQEMIDTTKSLIGSGRKLHLLNGVTSQITGGTSIEAKVSGGCDQYYDWDTRELRAATARELLRAVRLGELLPEVSFVGNPIIFRTGLDGAPIEERMRRLETAALIAKNTRKLGSMEVWNEREIDYLVEIGTVARGGTDGYLEKPCFVTAKETISPLFLDRQAGDILLALACRKLPCTVIPMPISGISAPVTMLGNAILCNAEILGVMTALHAACPDALVGGGSISGVLDMQTSVASFSAPEAILQDIAVAEVHEKLYGLNYLIGTGYTDAKLPGGQTLAEKTQKYFMSFLARRYSYPLGLLRAGSVFSAEQAIVDLEICRSIHANLRGIEGFEELDVLVDLIAGQGPRGSFIETEHTLANFRRSYLPRVFDRTSSPSAAQLQGKDAYSRAHEYLEELLKTSEPWHIESEKAREIDRIVDAARRSL